MPAGSKVLRHSRTLLTSPLCYLGDNCYFVILLKIKKTHNGNISAGRSPTLLFEYTDLDLAKGSISVMAL